MNIGATFRAFFQNNQSPNTSSAQVMSSNSDYGSVDFPVPWTVRVQTPVRRVPSGKMWSQPDRYKPDTYGGPQ